jgi:hypothetical protein
MATYDPYKLIDQVRELLHASGVDPVIVSEKDALVEACELLRSMGVFPAVDPLDFHARGDRNSWPETDDRNAAAYNDQSTG